MRKDNVIGCLIAIIGFVVILGLGIILGIVRDYVFGGEFPSWLDWWPLPILISFFIFGIAEEVRRKQI